MFWSWSRIRTRAITGTTAATNIGFKDQYRVDFIADRAVKFIEQPHDKPWLLFVSQLEPHQQNDVDAFVPPLRYADEFSWLVYRSQLVGAAAERP